MRVQRGSFFSFSNQTRSTSAGQCLHFFSSLFKRNAGLFKFVVQPFSVDPTALLCDKYTSGQPHADIISLLAETGASSV